MLDLAPLNLESICTITDTEAKEFQTHWDWEPHKPGEGAKISFTRWGIAAGILTHINISALLTRQLTHGNVRTSLHSSKCLKPTMHRIREWHLNSLPFLPMQKAIKLWEFLSKEPHTAIKPVMLYLRLAGMSGFLHSFSRYPQEGFAVANYFAATELAPAVARAFNKLKTLRQDASSWLLKYPNTPLPACCLQRSAKPVKHRTTPVLPCVCLPKTVISHCCKKSPGVITSRK